MTPIGILLLSVIALVVAARVKRHNRRSRQQALICANVKQTMRANYERSVKERQAAWRQYDNGHCPDDNYPRPYERRRIPTDEQIIAEHTRAIIGAAGPRGIRD